VLQAALWAASVQAAAFPGQPFPERTRQRLAAATTWLLALLDPESGRLPNLGPNDGAYLLPLAAAPFADYRPTLQRRAGLPRLRPAPGPGTNCLSGCPAHSPPSS
jgi:hypothetical protein